MFSPKRTALYLAIGAMALAAGEASAGCKLLSGKYVCASWITGSEICQVTVDINGPNTNGTVNQPNDVWVTCEVMGGNAYDNDDDDDVDYACPTGDLPEGTLICETTPPPEELFKASKSSKSAKSASASSGNGKALGWAKHDCKHADKNVGHQDPACIVTENTIPNTGETELSKTVQAHCNGNGICTATAELQPDPSACGSDQFIDFTADSFLGHVKACDGGEGCEHLWQWCTRNGDAYDCVEVPDPDDVCGE